jgi:hypothetical protein
MGDLKRTRKRPVRRRGASRRRLPDEPELVEPDDIDTDFGMPDDPPAAPAKAQEGTCGSRE